MYYIFQVMKKCYSKVNIGNAREWLVYFLLHKCCWKQGIWEVVGILAEISLLTSVNFRLTETSPQWFCIFTGSAGSVIWYRENTNQRYVYQFILNSIFRWSLLEFHLVEIIRLPFKEHFIREPFLAYISFLS